MMIHIITALLLVTQLIVLSSGQPSLGRLSALQPAFLGRAVSVLLDPDLLVTTDLLSELKWKVKFAGQNEFDDIRIGYTQNHSPDGVVLELNNVSKAWNKALILASFKNITSNAAELLLQEFENNCGHIYVMSYPAQPGDSGKIAYVPTKSVMDLKDGVNISIAFSVTMTFLRHNQFIRTVEPLNYKLVFDIYNVTSPEWYIVRCDTHTAKAYWLLEDTNVLRLFVGRPILNPLCSTKECSNCICLAIGDHISCSTFSKSVNISIGSTKLDVDVVQSYEGYNVYTVKKDFTEAHHMAKLTCSVAFPETGQMFITEAFIYIFVPPDAVTLDISELKEGYPLNITCSVSIARPPPKIEMFLGDKRIAEATQIEVFYHSTQFYRSYITLTSVNRTWNNMILNCSVLLRTINDAYMYWESKSQILNYKYPPIEVSMVPPSIPDNILPWYNFDISCTLTDHNTDCSFAWYADSRDIILNIVTNSNISSNIHVQMPHTSGGGGHRISCRVRCEEFFLEMIKNVKVIVPHAPVITIRDSKLFGIGGSVKILLTCVVDSYPLSNVSWIHPANRKMISRCEHKSECIMVTSELVESYLMIECTAVNKYGEHRKGLEVLPSETKSQEGFPCLPTSAGVGGAAVCVFVFVFFCFAKRFRNTQKRHSMQTRPNTIANVDAQLLDVLSKDSLPTVDIESKDELLYEDIDQTIPKSDSFDLDSIHYCCHETA
ncbi:uncharacterized protein LOC127836258 isoform X2 [Dreissena polymorpha]|uniref:uncharacterized protein LOC127836258 isoform X2 n=1 Tax=Dreissena polymorpha TaxID=45954 RepID=UPI002263F0B4|nr:uncharacterized protein LOC127836258 isoform X2 [Dreissena polymorpha]